MAYHLARDRCRGDIFTAGYHGDDDSFMQSACLSDWRRINLNALDIRREELWSLDGVGKRLSL